MTTENALQRLAASEAQRHNMLGAGACVLAGLSGGADSVALLHWLCAQRGELGLRVEAAHLNHGLRGGEAAADEAFCRALCAAWGVPLHVAHENVRTAAARLGVGVEEAGRNMRYAFFAATARRIGAAKVALAHTLSDRTETFLLSFSRGAALRGLCSIPPTRQLEAGIEIIRPLIACTRAQVEQYCAAQQLAFRVDASNFDQHFRRNAIRHSVLPPLKAAAPGLEDAARRMFLTLEADEAYLAGEADRLYAAAQAGAGAWDARQLAGAHAALRGRALRRIIAEAGCEPTGRLIAECDRLLPPFGSAGGAVTLAGQLRLCRRGDLLRLEQEDASPVPERWELPFLPGKMPLPGGRVLLSEQINAFFTKNLHENQKEGLANCLDYDTINGMLTIGIRRPGDVMHLCNGAGTKPLKKLFQERAIPPAERGRYLVLRDAEGPVWLEGFGCAHRCRLREPTAAVLRLAIANG
ncbi:MAG: tRNA lysidine(34) synthetase TilS [Oscillospiraceae bacterium]|jgi:tRNA(Ile)-lysidine synthase|nr:tRNA lysidine(34) synthetase TilS [Oscillospiraceae bacterium]